MQGNADAQTSLGYLYDHGHDVRQDYDTAKQWYEKAAAQNHAQAQYNLGYLYEHGQGVEQDDDIAKQWYSKACDNGKQTGCEKINSPTHQATE